MIYQSASNHQSGSADVDHYRGNTPANYVVSNSTGIKRSTYKDQEIISRMEIMRELRDQGVMVAPVVNDHKYVVPHDQWMRNNYNEYFKAYIYYLGAQYEAEGMDCDNYADFYRQNLVLSNLKAGGAKYGDVPCATMVVNQKDKGIYHALNLVRTQQGWYAVEPQDGTFTELNRYRYLNSITKMIF